MSSKGAGSSPRSRRLSRPLPFTVALPPPVNFTQQYLATSQDPCHSPPKPPKSRYFQEAVADVQSLYGRKGRDRENIIEERYDSAAIFENPVSLTKGRAAIADLFGLLGLVPGVSWSELGDITESQSYDGHRIMTFSHTVHFELLPFLRSEQLATPSRRRVYSIISLPATPFPQTPTASIRESFFGTPSSDGIFSRTHPAISASGLRSLLTLLSPKLIASNLTTLNMKLHTRLLFSHEGRILHHEDTWGLKELIEGLVPFGGFVYSLNRQGLGWMGGLVSRHLIGRESIQDDERSRRAIGEGVTATTCGRLPPCSTIKTPEEEEISAFPVQRPVLIPLDIGRVTTDSDAKNV